jgi:hypothetical protein
MLHISHAQVAGQRFGSLQIEIAAVVGILKLSAKYDIPHLRLNAISQLSIHYPTTLAAWDKRPTALLPGSFSPFAVLDLARLLDIPQILPAAFFDCSTQSNDAFLKSIMQRSTPGSPTTNDVRICLNARQDLLEATFTRAYAFLLRDSDILCRKAGSCAEGKLRWLTTAFATQGRDPLAIQVKWSHSQLCGYCLSQAKEDYTKARQKLWDDLPSYFSLPPWDQLLQTSE